MIRNSLICKLINVQASMKEKNEKKIKNCDEISKLIKAFPKDIASVNVESLMKDKARDYKEECNKEMSSCNVETLIIKKVLRDLINIPAFGNQSLLAGDEREE